MTIHPDRSAGRLTKSVSVLMACRNAEAFIAEAIESVLNQTFQDFELVVVDDGSTDRSPEIIKRYVCDTVKLLQQVNRGAAAARNVAFENSCGEYVIFVDADDVIEPCHLEALHACAAQHQGCIALSRWTRFRDKPSEGIFPDRPTEQDLSPVEWMLLDWANARPMTQSGMLLIPRALIELYGGWNEQLNLLDDFEFFARMISRSGGIRFSPRAKLYYRSGIPNSLSRNRSRKAAESAWWSLLWGTDQLLALEDSPRTRRVCANLLRDFEYTFFPAHRDLRTEAASRVAELGGADIEPDGPPGFQRLRALIGWKLARRVQRLAEALKDQRGTSSHSPSIALQ